MNRQQAINYLLSSGFSEEQINTIEQAFKQEPTNDLVVDCISRQAVIDLMMQKWGENFSGDDAMQESIDAIRVMPSVTPQEPRWIPVSERLPEPYMFVNATCRSLVDDREDWVVETIYLPIPKEHNPRHYSDWGNIPMLNLGEAEVIAWMERIIPEPYVVEEQGENT